MRLDGREAKVVEVIDGDTFKVELDGTIETIRLIGIDAPELTDAAGQRGLAARARDVLGELLAAGPVELVADIEEQQGERLLRHALRDDGFNLAEALARDGWARALARPPNLAYEEAIATAVAEARAAGRGMWVRPPTGLTLQVDKIDEVVRLRNASEDPVDLSGWWLVSLRGQQAFRFPSGSVLPPGEELTVASGEAEGDLRFGDQNVWNNAHQDSAELRMPDGRVAVYWDDPGPP